MHHGLYPPGSPPKTHAQAQADMIDELLAWAGVRDVASMVDVGCGIGGSSRHVARAWRGARATGFTLSPVQAARANAITAADPTVAGRCTYAVGDALAMPLPDGTVDLAWSLESGEHMPDKAAFVGELARVCAPGGTVIIATWCHRDLTPGEASLARKEQKLLARINRAYYLPPWCSGADYEALLAAAGMADIRRADWSEAVAPFWGAVIRSALSVRGLRGLLGAGWKTIKVEEEERRGWWEVRALAHSLTHIRTHTHTHTHTHTRTHTHTHMHIHTHAQHRAPSSCRSCPVASRGGPSSLSSWPRPSQSKEQKNVKNRQGGLVLHFFCSMFDVQAARSPAGIGARLARAGAV
jgi:SAM-dependent methyltransferase